ncbi:hypothetical protein [Photorhabdus viridis]
MKLIRPRSSMVGRCTAGYQTLLDLPVRQYSSMLACIFINFAF